MERFSRPETAYLPLRTYLCLRTLIVAAVSLFMEGSLNGRFIEQGGTAAYTVVMLLVLCASVGLLDVLINDVLPAQYHMSWARGYRHIGYIGLAVGNTAFLLVMAKQDTVSLLALSYAVDATFASLVAVGTVVRNQRSRQYPAIDRRRARAP
jgi:hypothetical protein